MAGELDYGNAENYLEPMEEHRERKKGIPGLDPLEMLRAFLVHQYPAPPAPPPTPAQTVFDRFSALNPTESGEAIATPSDETFARALMGRNFGRQLLVGVGAVGHSPRMVNQQLLNEDPRE